MSVQTRLNKNSFASNAEFAAEAEAGVQEDLAPIRAEIEALKAQVASLTATVAAIPTA